MNSTDPIDRGRRNPYCSRCGDERGGPYGHETNECTWRRKQADDDDLSTQREIEP